MPIEREKQPPENAQFGELLRLQSQLQEERKARLRKKLSENSGVLPAELFLELTRLFITDFIDVMQSHAGFLLERKFRSLQTTFELFKFALADLRKALNEFDEFSHSDEFGHRVSRARHSQIETKIRKELYCFSNLAHSLQDHCRRLVADWKPSDFDAQLKDCFGNDGLHDFICGLRRAMHHVSMIEADWQLRNMDSEMTSHYVLKRSELLAEQVWNERALACLEKMVDEIDVSALATEYSRRVVQFYCWLLAEFQEGAPLAVREYRRCMNEHKKYCLRMEWGFVLNSIYLNLKEKIDPYRHLSKYLHAGELERAMKFRMHSREQVDYIISVVDEDGACTDEIRAAVYRLFDVSDS